MINTNRIIPIQKIDFLSMIGIVLTLDSVSYTVAASDVDGNFTLTGTGDVGNVIANQPVQSLNFASGVTAAVVYFVVDYDYSGFSVAGVAVTPSGATVNADGISLYKATLSSGAVTIAALTPSVS